MVDGLRRWAIRRGYQLAWGPSAALAAARDAIQARRFSGEFEAGFYQERLASFEADSRAPWDGASTVLVVVVPRPAHSVAFVLDGRIVEAVIPPTYVQYQALFREVGSDLQRHALPGVQVERLNAPLKALAACLGLVHYGRNNLAYAPVFGSYCQLVGFLTDATLPVAPGWRPHEAQLLPECRDCGICHAVCPTGAIGTDRILLHAERCLTFANESPGAWPDWIPPSAHHCLIGCLRCQRACPANPELRIEKSGVAFTAEETAALLAGAGAGTAADLASIHAKLESLGQDLPLPELSRNLQALLRDRRAALARPGPATDAGSGSAA